MVKSKSKIIRFLNKYVFKNMLICMLCVSSVIGLTACCYPSAITRSATDGEGYSELDYLNSMFSGAMVLTSLTADELASDYLFYDEKSKGADTDAGNKKLHSYFNLADRQFTSMAQYIQRMVNTMYGGTDTQGNFLGWDWLKKFNIMNPGLFTNDPNCVYEQNIIDYYVRALITDPTRPSTPGANGELGTSSNVFQISHTNPYFQYACSEVQGCNYKFNTFQDIDARLKIYNNATERSDYKANTSDNTGKIHIAPIWIPDDGEYHYYVVSNVRNANGTPTGSGTTKHLYNVLNADAVALDENQNANNSHFLWWSWNDSYKSDDLEHTDWECAKGSTSVFDFKENAPNVKNIEWNSGGYYTYDYGFQTGNSLVKSNSSGKESDNYKEVRYIDWYTPDGGGKDRYYLGVGESEDIKILGLKVGESCNYGNLYSDPGCTNKVGNYVQGWYNAYFQLDDVKTLQNVGFNYFMYNNLYFPVDGYKSHPYGSVHDVITGDINTAPLFDGANGSVPCYKKVSDRRSTTVYLTIRITDTKQITKVFNHNKYFNDFEGTSWKKTTDVWEHGSDFTTKKIKYALAAINRYGTYEKADKAYSGGFKDCLSKKNYKLNIANSKSIGLSQEFYEEIINYMKFYIIGKGTSWFDSYFGSYRTAGWLWTESENAKTTYLGDSGTTPYAEIFAANNDKAKIAIYKAYDFIIPRIIGSMFSLKVVAGNPETAPYFNTRTDICEALIEGTFDTDSEEDYFDINTTLFPTVVAGRIYTYGNISTLNRLYNYEMGIDYAPFDVEESDGKSFENYEGYQDKIGRYLYLYEDKKAYKDNPTQPLQKVEKTLEQFLYGTGDKAITDYSYEGSKYYLPVHKGVLDVVTDAKMQSLILFPKVTKDPDPNNPSTKPDNEYGEYICVDPTFITSMIGKNAEAETYVNMSVELAGLYTYNDTTDEVEAVKSHDGNGTKVYSVGQSFNHNHANTIIDNNGNFTTSEVTKYLHVQGNEYYTDLAVMQLDKDKNIIRVSDDNNIPRYYFDDQVDEYGEYIGGTPLTGEEQYTLVENADGTYGVPSGVKFFTNYSREVYIYTEDYMYFKSGFNKFDENHDFSLYTYTGYGTKKINTTYFYSDHEDKIWTSPFTNYRVKYDAYKIRSNLFDPLPNGYTLNTAVVGSYIKIDYEYYKEYDKNTGEFSGSQDNTAYTGDGVGNNSETEPTKDDNATDSFSNDDTNDYSTSYSTNDSSNTHLTKEQEAAKYGFALDIEQVNYHLFETGIYAVDCGVELMKKQDNTDFPVNMVGDWVVTFVDNSSGDVLFSMGANNGADLRDSSAYANYFGTGGKLVNGSWQIGGGYYVATKYKVPGKLFSNISNLGGLTIYGNTTVYLQLSKYQTTLTYDYTSIFSSYADYIPESTLNKYKTAASRKIDKKYDKGQDIVPSTELIDLGDGIEITGWKLYVGSETGAGQNLALATSLTMMVNYRIVPVIGGSKYRVTLNANGGEFSDRTTFKEYFVEADKKLSTNSTLNSMSDYPVVTHPQGFALKGWSKTGFDTGMESFATLKSSTMPTEDITYYAVWNTTTVKVDVNYVSSGDTYYNDNSTFRSLKVDLDRTIANFDVAVLPTQVNSVKGEITYESIEDGFIYNSKYYKFMGFTPITKSYTSVVADRDNSINIYLSDTSVGNTSNYFTTNTIFNSSNNSGINLNSTSYIQNNKMVLRAVYQRMFKVEFVTDATTYTVYVASGATLNDNSTFVTNKNIIDGFNTEELQRWTKTQKTSASDYKLSDVLNFNTLLTTAVTSNVKYYQVKDNISVTYYNRSLGVHTTQSYLAGETITSLPALSGSAGWSISSTTQNLKDPATYINSTAGTYNFYAWYSFDVVYHYNGTTYTETVSGSNIPSGHSAANVVGWSSTQNGTSPVNLSSYRNSNATVHLYAIYEYTATFTWHGGSTSQTLRTSYAVDSVSFTLPPSPADYTDGDKKYTFDYWSCNGSKVTSTSFSSNVTIVAQYKEVVETPTT